MSEYHYWQRKQAKMEKTMLLSSNYQNLIIFYQNYHSIKILCLLIYAAPKMHLDKLIPQAYI